MITLSFLAVDYRLAPDSPFPAALHDALAAYLYLINPPADAGVKAVDPKNIVIMGDSAGGGIKAISTLPGFSFFVSHGMNRSLKKPTLLPHRTDIRYHVGHP